LLRIPHQRRDLAAFDHIVVLMMENRSFVQLLGYLYEPDTVPRGQAFEGVAGKHLANPIPADAEQAARQVVPPPMRNTVSLWHAFRRTWSLS
jgi:phospholipase C